jgi:hypothetical protein
VRAGKIRGAKAGRQWRFTREEIDRFLKGQTPVVALATDIKPLLNALAERLVSSRTKIVAIEYPVEYMLPVVAQVQVAPAEGLSSSAALRAALRAAPNVLLIRSSLFLPFYMLQM